MADEEVQDQPAEQPEDTNRSIANIEKQAKGGFLNAIQKRYIEKYADDTIKMLSEYKALKHALKQYDAWIKRVDAGDMTAIDEYKKKRIRLEDEDGYEF